MKNETHALTVHAQQKRFTRRQEIFTIAIIFLIGVSVIIFQFKLSNVGQGSNKSAEVRRFQSNDDAQKSLMSFEEELRAFFLNVPLV